MNKNRCGDYIKKWDLCNEILNGLRQKKGEPLVPRIKNPYLSSYKEEGDEQNV